LEKKNCVICSKSTNNEDFYSADKLTLHELNKSTNLD